MAVLHVQTKRWTKAEYHRMIEVGLIGEDERVELIQGEIVPMAAHNPPHSAAVQRSNMALIRLYGDTHDVRCQLPFDAPDDTEPEPDFLILSRSLNFDPRLGHPSEADLIVEVADSSLTYERDVKSSLYAWAKVPEYWISNLVDRCVEVFRDPQPMTGNPLGHGYQTRLTLHPGQGCRPLFAPHVAIDVIDLLGG